MGSSSKSEYWSSTTSMIESPSSSCVAGGGGNHVRSTRASNSDVSIVGYCSSNMRMPSSWPNVELPLQRECLTKRNLDGPPPVRLGWAGATWDVLALRLRSGLVATGGEGAVASGADVVS